MRFWLLILMLVVGAPAWAQGPALSVDLENDQIDITTGFTGGRLSLFGVKDAPGDIAIVVTGPQKDMLVRKKKQVAQIWMNRDAVSFHDVPVFYDYAVSKPADKMATPKLLRAHNIGPENIQLQVKKKDQALTDLADYKKALIRNKQEEGLYPVEAKEVRFISDKFFRATFYVPAHVPTGAYNVETYLIRNGRVVSSDSANVRVAQTGTSAQVFRFAHEWALAYGILCVVLSVTAGWLSNVVRRRS